MDIAHTDAMSTSSPIPTAPTPLPRKKKVHMCLCFCNVCVSEYCTLFAVMHDSNELL